ncbi:MAG: hypothetical protein JF571_03015 [Asticcacaulis sp.]|nr:hypothetical protein [Asticcacaulis sp.]
MPTETLPPQLSLNPQAKITVRQFGTEGQPLIVIDDVMLHPEEMVAYAVTRGQFSDPPAGSYYPGRNGILPPEYGPALCTALRPFLERVFGLPQGMALSHEGFFGIACLPPEQLQPLQAIPHFDAANPQRIACVHYLCRPPYRGTAFYRHIATGYESIHGLRVEPYRRSVLAELQAAGDTVQSHAGGDVAGYERIETVDAVFNRLILYRATSLHAGILNEMALGRNPDDGRLTANSFIEAVRPKRF